MRVDCRFYRVRWSMLHALHQSMQIPYRPSCAGVGRNSVSVFLPCAWPRAIDSVVVRTTLV